MRRTLLFSLALTLLFGSKAAAQACLGMPSFTSGPMQIAGGITFADGANGFGGSFGYGSSTMYGKVGVGTTSYDALDGSSFDFGVSGGYQLQVDRSHKAALCPIASLSLNSGPNDVLGSGVDMSSRTFAFGAALGAPVGHNPRVQILPNASLQFANTRLEIEDATGSAAGSESYGLLTLGTGFVFNSRISVNPSLTIPMGLDGGDTAFGISAALNFGH